MFILIYIEYRNPETHDIHEIGSGTKLLFTFLSLKVFRHEEREAQSFYADCFYIFSFQSNQRAAPVAHKSRLASPSSENQPYSSEARTQLTAFSQISAHAFSAWRHLDPIPIWDFYFDISEWYISEL